MIWLNVHWEDLRFWKICQAIFNHTASCLSTQEHLEIAVGCGEAIPMPYLSLHLQTAFSSQLMAKYIIFISRKTKHQLKVMSSYKSSNKHFYFICFKKKSHTTTLKSWWWLCAVQRPTNVNNCIPFTKMLYKTETVSCKLVSHLSSPSV